MLTRARIAMSQPGCHSEYFARRRWLPSMTAKICLPVQRGRRGPWVRLPRCARRLSICQQGNEVDTSRCRGSLLRGYQIDGGTLHLYISIERRSNRWRYVGSLPTSRGCLSREQCRKAMRASVRANRTRGCRCPGALRRACRLGNVEEWSTGYRTCMHDYSSRLQAI